MADRAIDQLSKYIANTTYEDIPSRIINRAADCVLDVLGSAIAGRSQLSVEAMQSVMEKGIKEGPCRIWFANKKSNAIAAATINAMAATSLDIDDGHRRAVGHPGAAVISSASATAEEIGATFDKYLCSIVLGYEAAIRVALARRVDRNESTVSGRWSGVGACVARAKLLNLSPAEISQSILIAEQHAPRVSSAMHHGFAGSDVKEGISWSVLSGMYAVDLAQAGFEGYPDTFEQNILYDPKILDNNLDRYDAIDGLFFKPYACCRWIHSAIDALDYIITSLKISSHVIDHVEVLIFDKAVKLGNHVEPKNESEAQFSIPFCLAAVALGGTKALRPLNKSLIGQQAVINFAKKVKIKNEPSMESMFPAKAPAIVRVKHTNGYEEKFIDAAFGDPTNPMSRKDLQEKFLVFSNTNMLHKKASSVIHMLSDLPNSLGDTPLKKFNILA
jgi:2-methylcitrate dehydratase PrpD